MLLLTSISQESKSIFSSFRMFTLNTQPGNFLVKRNRADFKWLAEKLSAEFPNKVIQHIDKGELNKKVVEEYFCLLIEKERMQNSRYLNYFLTADDRMFEERKNSEEGILSHLRSKFKRPAASIETLGVSDSKKTKVLTSKEEGDMQLFLDELQEALRVCTTLYKQYVLNYIE